MTTLVNPILGYCPSIRIRVADRNWFHPIRARFMEIENETMNITNPIQILI
jgi:hypothetical protein